MGSNPADWRLGGTLPSAPLLTASAPPQQHGATGANGNPSLGLQATDARADAETAKATVLRVEAMPAGKIKVGPGRHRQAELRGAVPAVLHQPGTGGHIPATGAHTFPLLA